VKSPKNTLYTDSQHYDEGKRRFAYVTNRSLGDVGYCALRQDLPRDFDQVDELDVLDVMAAIESLQIPSTPAATTTTRQ
jgi:hypothetical protein